MSPAQPIPEGFRSVTPYMVVNDAAKAIDFYKQAFAAEEIVRMPGPDGHGVMHAELKIGDSMVMLADEFPGQEKFRAPSSLNGTTVSLHVYVEDVDKAFERALAAGATVTMPLSDMFWGDRYGKVTDPFGHEWALATHKEDLTPEQIGQRAAQFFSQQPGCGQ